MARATSIGLPTRLFRNTIIVGFAVLAAGGCRSNLATVDPAAQSLDEAPYQLFVMVSAPQLDFSSAQLLMRSMAKNAQRGGDRTIGHAWIRLVGPDRQIECGHTGQEDVAVESYERGLLRRLEAGEPDPVAYLWQALDDGWMQPGGGGHVPTLSAGRELEAGEYDRICRFIDEYDFRCYSLHEPQCVTLVTGVLAEVGIFIDATQRIPITREQQVGGTRRRFWSDVRYSVLEIPTPQMLEARLRERIECGELVQCSRR